MNTVLNYIVEKYPNELEINQGLYIDPYYVEYKLAKIKVSFTEVVVGTEMVSTLTTDHNKLVDAPYSMFAIEFNQRNLKFVNKISVEMSNFIYDIQILPYSPVSEMLETTLTNEVDYNSITIGGEEVGRLYWAKKSSGTFTIPTKIEYDFSDNIEVKLANECDIYRIVSPNFNGAYEFSAAKNEGVEFFNVSYTYKPFTPYILVSPNFKRLYGNDFSDARGLICNGDFSIATITDQWKTYEINNKNYQNIFDTEIKTNDAVNQLNLVGQTISSGMNAITTGLAVGAMGGGIAGGIAAAAGSAISGAADIAIGQSVYQKNRQSKIDIFNMTLQNVKARPDTLNKISAYNINNKYFPFVEKYTCTEVEREALRNKIKYDGMTVGIISTISEFINSSQELNYIKGQLIMLENISEDYHIVDAIGVELEKGVYF